MLSTIALALTLSAGSGLRLVNDHDFVVQASVRCGSSESSIAIGPHALADVEPCDDMAVSSIAPLTLIETTDTTQRIISDASCETIMSVPLFACKRGTASAAVPDSPGASYNWTLEGATLISGDGTNRIAVQLTDAAQAKLTCVIVRPDCTSSVVGMISVRDPLVIGAFNAPLSAAASTPVTLDWSYQGTSLPTMQMLTGDAFPEPVTLPASQRSYTFTPVSSGQRTVELRASYGGAILIPQVANGKRRSAGKSTVGASACPDAHASAHIDVQGCVVRKPVINAPLSVEAGSTFDATTSSADGDTEIWTVKNGTIVSQSRGRVTVRPDQQGNLDLSLRVERNPSCFAESTQRVTVKPKEAACSVSPSGKVELINQTCDKGTLRATFTGRAPFFGTWSDGVQFVSSTDTVTRDVTQYGDYSIRDFKDGSTCQGLVQGSARFERYQAKAELSLVGGACTNAKIKVKFTGTPPFEGKLYSGDWRGEWFKTNDMEMTIQPQIVGGYWIEAVSDARCSDHQASSNRVEIVGAAPVLTVSDKPACAYYPEQPPLLGAIFDWGPPPYTIYWADGAVTKSTDNNYLQRQVPLPKQPIEYYDITRATTGNCEAVIPNKRAAASFRVQPRINNNLSRDNGLVCPGKTGTTSLVNTLPSNATINWTIQNGEIVSGQGTSTVVYRPVTPNLNAQLRATATYPDNACSSYDFVGIVFPGDPAITEFRFDPPTIKAGGTSTIRIKTNGYVTGFGWLTTPTNRRNDAGLPTCTNFSTECTFTYKDTIGPGSVQFDLQYNGECTDHYRTTSTTLTITP